MTAPRLSRGHPYDRWMVIRPQQEILDRVALTSLSARPLRDQGTHDLPRTLPTPPGAGDPSPEPTRSGSLWTRRLRCSVRRPGARLRFGPTYGTLLGRPTDVVASDHEVFRRACDGAGWAPFTTRSLQVSTVSPCPTSTRSLVKLTKWGTQCPPGQNAPLPAGRHRSSIPMDTVAFIRVTEPGAELDSPSKPDQPGVIHCDRTTPQGAVADQSGICHPS